MGVQGPSSEAPIESGSFLGIEAITVASTADSVIRAMKVPEGAEWLQFEVKNSGAAAFDQFDIQQRAHSSGNWVTIATAAADYSSLVDPLIEVTGAPVTLAAAASTLIKMTVNATESIRILASGNAAATTAELYYRFGA